MVLYFIVSLCKKIKYIQIPRIMFSNKKEVTIMQHILIADDNRDITDILSTYSKMEGFEPLVAADGEEAIRLFNEYKPDVVLLDVMMPKEDGYEVCRKIRKKSNVPVILITARGEDFDKIMG